jgi:hypothetical protein
MSGRLKKPSASEPALEIEESGSPEATMATATTIMMAVIKRSNIIFPLGRATAADYVAVRVMGDSPVADFGPSRSIPAHGCNFRDINHNYSIVT